MYSMALKAGFLVAYLLVTPIVTSRTNLREMNRHEEKRHLAPKPSPPKRCANPCKGAAHNTTVDTADGRFVCLVPTVQELVEQLNKIGGYNHHYVAVTLEEAEANFDNLLPKKIKPKPTLPYSHMALRPSHGRRWKLGHKEKLRSSADASSAKANEAKVRQKRELSCLTPTCQVAGQPTRDGNRVCPACQRCKKLPDNIFPNYVNEVSCDNSRSGNSITHFCFPNIGTCKQKTMAIDLLTHEDDDYEVVKKEDNVTYMRQVWKTKSIAINSCCECYS